MTRAAVLDLLAKLEAAGVRLALNESGDGLRVYGEGRPRPEVMEEVRTLKPALLAHFQGGEEESQSPAPDLSPSPGAGESVTTCPEARRPAAPLPDWEAISAQPGRCGSCARAVDVSEEWGRYMVRCSAPQGAWWPSAPPLAIHVGALCGAYLRDGEEVGTGYKSRAAAQASP